MTDPAASLPSGPARLLPAPGGTVPPAVLGGLIVAGGASVLLGAALGVELFQPVLPWALLGGMTMAFGGLLGGTLTGGAPLAPDLSSPAPPQPAPVPPVPILQVIERAPYPVMVHAEDGSVLQYSRAWLTASGFRVEQIATVPDWVEQAHAGDGGSSGGGGDGDAVRRHFAGLYQLDGPGEAWEFAIRTARGQSRTWAFRSAPLGCDGTGRRLMVTMAADITGHRATEERLRLLMHEVDHRAKNALAVVQAIVRLSQAEDPAAYATAVEGRIGAMARAHTLLAGSGWSGAGLHAIMEQELAAGDWLVDRRLQLSGAAVTIKPEAVQPLSLALHELTSNAIRHGGLAAADGGLTLCWAENRTARRLEIDWRESGGAPAQPPARRGFGLTLTDLLVRQQLGGEIMLDWQATGLRCRISLPGDCFDAGDAPAAGGPRDTTAA